MLQATLAFSDLGQDVSVLVRQQVGAGRASWIAENTMPIAFACPLCLSLALRVQDRGLFGACGGDPAVAEIEQMIHRKPRRGHIIYPHREQAGVVRAEHTHRQVQGLQGRATSSSVGARLATGWHQYAH